jgi:YbbR domain-containing protein
MRRIHRTLLAAFFATSLVSVANADNAAVNMPHHPEQMREQIERLYRLEQAFVTCEQVRMTGHDLKRLDDAIAEFEAISGLSENDLESIYEQVENAAAEKTEAFCADIPDFSADLRPEPASQQR